MKKLFPKTVKIALILVYLVIFAGALVRMTGSGMGCPDWPKCFGYYIPPTERATLEWQPNKIFEKGQVIIVNEKLWVAKTNFKSGLQYNHLQFEAFTKHDYAEFNATKTWIEYLNRLVGALAGLACFIMAIFSFSYFKINKKITILSWIVVFAMGFQGWLGAKVVYSVLNPLKITIHMIMALLIVAFILLILKQISKENINLVFSTKIKWLIFISFGLSLVQIGFGTQVRQMVDEQVKSGILIETVGLQNPDFFFYFHRSFSIVVVLINFYIAFLISKVGKQNIYIKIILFTLFIEILSGIAMFYFNFPFSTQAIHLVFASILFGLQFYLYSFQIKLKKVDLI